MIIALSHPGDDHANAVGRMLGEAGVPVRLVDLSELPARASIALEMTNGSAVRAAYRTEVETIDLGAATAFWWRRPQWPDLTAMHDPDHHAFAMNEWNEALHGLWEVVGGRWMNPPATDLAASRKARQLQVARRVGLRTPRTLMTSDPDRARDFVANEGAGRAIFKTFSCTQAVWRETRVVTEADLSVLDTVRNAPVIFQEFVPAGEDIRVTVVGDQIFAAEISTGETSYTADFRPVLGEARTAATELPTTVASGLRALMAELGLVYGAADFRRTPDGDHYFLEVNTAGEFLFVERLTGLPITRAVADWLAGSA